MIKDYVVQNEYEEFKAGEGWNGLLTFKVNTNIEKCYLI